MISPPMLFFKPLSDFVRLAGCAAALLASSLPGHAQQILIPENQSWNILHPMGSLPPRADTTPDPDFDTTWYLPQAQFLTDYDGPSFGASTVGDPADLPTADSGPKIGPFAYGGVDAITAPGTTLTRPNSGNRYTSYFRTVFTVPAGGLRNPSVRMVCDDGCYLYLDGVLIATVNVTNGVADTYTSFATDATNTEVVFSFPWRAAATLPGGSPDDVKVIMPVPTLSAGVHTLAVSVHNSGTASSDLGLLLELSASGFGATVTEARLDNSGYRFTIVDEPTSTVQTGSVTLNIDGAAVTPTSVTKTGGVTLVFYAATGLPLGSLHTYVLTAKDQANANITGSGNVRSPYFPTAALPGPAGSPGVWGMRDYRNGTGWGSGLDFAVSAARGLPAADPDPADPVIIDGTAPVVNHTDPEQPGTGGNFNNDLPFIGNQAGPDDNLMVIAKTQIVITAAGPVTYSVHSDDGMGLRISGGPPAGAGSKFVSFSGGGRIDSDLQTLIFPGTTTDSNTRGVYNFTAPGTYDVQFAAFESANGSSWEVASAPGTFAADRDTNTWTLVGNPNAPAMLAVPYKPRWVTNPPGIPGEAGKFGVRTYFSASGVDTLQKTSDFLRDTVRTPADGDNLTFDTLRSSLNARDPGSTNAPQGVIGGDDLVNEDPNSPQGANDNVVTVAKGRISVPAASFYTFWARGDDGFMLRLKAVTGPNPSFKRATNGDPLQANGRFEMSNPNELFFDAGTGDSNTRGIVFLAAGQYDIEYLQWEGVGGFWYELTAAAGEFPHGTEPTSGWRPVGYKSPASTIVVPGIAARGWSVETSLPDTAAGNLVTIAAAEALFSGGGITTTTWPQLNFTDPESGNNGSFTPNNSFPRNTTADDNNYAMRATGSLVITQSGEYNLGFQGDDGGYMDITGPGNPMWISVLETNHPAQAMLTESVPGSGVNNRLQVEVGTGNSRTIGNITLAAGTYTLKTLVYEGGGGSWWEVIGAKAPVIPSFNYPLLVQGSGSTVTDADVLLLVGPPSTESIPVTNLTYNSATGAYSLTFVSAAGTNYQLEYTTAMEAGPAGTPQKWNIAPGAPTAGAAGTTTISGNVSTLRAPGGVLPAGPPRLFLRARRL